MAGEREVLVAIPGLGLEDIAVLQSLLRSGGFLFFARDGEYAEILIRTSDVAGVKEFLTDYRVRNPSDQAIPIPW